MSIVSDLNPFEAKVSVVLQIDTFIPHHSYNTTNPNLESLFLSERYAFISGRPSTLNDTLVLPSVVISGFNCLSIE